MPTSVIASPIESDSAVTANVKRGDPERETEHEIEEVLAGLGEARERGEAGFGGGESCHGSSVAFHEASNHVAIPPAGLRLASGR